MLYTKHVQPDDGLLLKSKHGAPLTTCIFSCVDCYYVIITLKQNGMSNLQIPLYCWLINEGLGHESGGRVLL